jgi:hypothetical protein
MGGSPRVCHLECRERQTVIVIGEETAHLTGDCADVAGPPSISGLFFYLAIRKPPAARNGSTILSLRPRPAALPRPKRRRPENTVIAMQSRMNVHSRLSLPMIPAENLPGEPSSERESSRRTRVLAAAERAFARQGFHAATMQDVAAEARMSF